MFTASELFDLAIQVEINGERFYRYALDLVDKESLRDVLRWLADQESQHKDLYREIRENFSTEPGPQNPASTDEERLVLRAAMGRHAFSLDELNIASLRDDKELLKAAIAFEDDAILFFEFISSLVSDPKALSTLEEIRREELKHRELLREKMTSI
ncbi:MAG: ferritin family protein [Syntrophobacteraceae bacterium]